jgi:hypothetical protein
MTRLVNFSFAFIFFLMACTPGPKEQLSKPDTIQGKPEETTVQDGTPRIPSNSTLEDGLYRILPAIGNSFEYDPEKEDQYKILESIQARIDKGEIKYDDLSEEDQLALDDLNQSGGYWSVGVSPGPTWSSEFPPQKVQATSTLPASKNADYNVGNLIDEDLRTVWSEGAQGNGIGESISFQYSAKNQFGNTTVLTSVTILNGFVKRNDLWKKNGRVKTFKLYINEKPFALLELEDSKAFQTFDLGEISSPAGFTLTFEIFEVYPGEVFEDVVVSYITFDGDGVLCLEASTKIEMADGSFKRIDQITAGDEIRSLDIRSNTLAIATVAEIGKAFHNNLVEIILESKTITVTMDHPFIDEHNHLVAVNPGLMTSVFELKPGTKLKVIDREEIKLETVKLIRPIHGNRITYSITRTSTNQPYLGNSIWIALENPIRF